MPQLKSVALFAGVGSFEYAAEQQGRYEPTLFCEIDKTAQTVLKGWKPLVKLHPDVRTLGDLPRDATLMCAGFPCNDLSYAGLKEGIAGEKSGLVFEIFRLLAIKRIDNVLIENVPGMLSLNDGEAMDAVTTLAERLGYRWAYRQVCTSTFGQPHRRERVYFSLSMTQDPREVLLCDDAGQRPKAKAEDVDVTRSAVGFYWHEGRGGWGMAVDAVPPLRAGGKIPTPPAIMLPNGMVGTPHIEDAERLQHLPPGWTKLADRVEPRSRWRLVGNAVTSSVPWWILDRLAKPGSYDSSRDPSFNKSTKRWPRAAWGTPNGGCFASSVSQNPLGVEMPRIDGFLRHPLTPLSARATRGFLKRAGEGRLHFPDGFIARMQAHLARMEAETDLFASAA